MHADGREEQRIKYTSVREERRTKGITFDPI